MSTPAAAIGAIGRRDDAADGRLAPAIPIGPARLIGFLALATFAALHWARLVAVSADGRMVEMVALSAAGGVVLALAGHRLTGRTRVVAATVVTVVCAAGVMLAAGVPLSLLRPRAWDDLADGIGQGLTVLPDLRVPYVGVDVWPRIVILAGGGALLLLAGLLACRPLASGRARLIGAVALTIVFATPTIELAFTGQTLRGAVFAVLLAGYFWLERIPRRRAPSAVALLAGAVLAGILLTPVLDGSKAWIDYQELAASVGPRAGTRFNFDHGYGPIDWPRDGRQVLRVKARSEAYWKASNLDRFDGLRWRRLELSGSRAPSLLAELPRGWERHTSWLQNITVTVRGMTSDELISAGDTISITKPPRAAIPSGSPGVFDVAEPLRSGDSYTVTAYTPRPTPAQLRRAGADFPSFAAGYLTLDIPRGPGAPSAAGDERAPPYFAVAPVRFPAFGGLGTPLTSVDGADRPATALLEDSPYARTWALAQRLRSGAATPYAYVRAIETYLSRGFSYTESPPRSAVPLDAFLFRDKAGYCQQFSGAMALLLRMGGVPARVAGGFTPGAYSDSRREYSVRDIDAHSWVEAWFPGIGWVTFDPTPASAPARLQLTIATPGASTGSGPVPGLTRGGDRPESGGLSPIPRGEDGGGGLPWLWIGFGLLVLGGATGAVVVARRRPPAEAGGVDPWLEDLRRGLRRSRRRVGPGTTLRSLEREVADPAAAGYLRAVRDARFGAAAAVPTTAERRGLRRELGGGHGLRARLRGLWAVPPGGPRRPRPQPPYTS